MFARRFNKIIIRNYMIETSIPLNQQIEQKIISKYKQKNDYSPYEYINKFKLNRDNDKIIGKLNEIKKLTKDLYIYRS